MFYCLRPSPATIYSSSSSLFIKNKTTKPAPAVFHPCSSSLNFFTNCTVAFHFWKATVHFVKIKISIFFCLTPPPPTAFCSGNFSFSSHFFRNFFSLFFSLLSLCSLGFSVWTNETFGLKIFWGFWSTKISLSSEIFLGFSVVKHEKFLGFSVAGVVVVDSVVAWACRRGLLGFLLKHETGHGLKEMPTPRRREPPQPAAVACRARSLPVWRSPTAKPAAWGCRAWSRLVWRSPTAKPAAWGCLAHRNEFCKLICLGCWNFWVGLLEFWNFFRLLEFLGCWNFFLFGCFVWLLWWEIDLVGVGYFWWEVIIKK